MTVTVAVVVVVVVVAVAAVALLAGADPRLHDAAHETILLARMTAVIVIATTTVIAVEIATALEALTRGMAKSYQSISESSSC